MITKTDLETYGFSDIEEYFIHIVDTQLCGNNSDVKPLFIKLSKPQRKIFLLWIVRQILIKANTMDNVNVKVYQSCIDVIY